MKAQRQNHILESEILFHLIHCNKNQGIYWWGNSHRDSSFESSYTTHPTLDAEILYATAFSRALTTVQKRNSMINREPHDSKFVLCFPPAVLALTCPTDLAFLFLPILPRLPHTRHDECLEFSNVLICLIPWLPQRLPLTPEMSPLLTVFPLLPFHLVIPYFSFILKPFPDLWARVALLRGMWVASDGNAVLCHTGLTYLSPRYPIYN